MNRFLKSSKSLSLNKLYPYYNYSTPKKNNSKINLYNFNYLEKSPSSNIKVFCKFRPLNEIESMCSEKEMIKIDSSKHLLLKTENPSKSIQEFTFDGIFEPNSYMLSFYNKVCKNIVSHTIQGYNGGIIFYGESGTGKTFTIKQIIPQISSQIYEEIGLSDCENNMYKIHVAVYEIYKEQINDLLHMKKMNLNLIELKNKKVIIDNLTYYEVNNEEELNDIISQGLINKEKYNNNIKSHFIIEMKIYYKDKNIMKCGTLHLLELEGIEGLCSEREIDEEQKAINKSISALKMVVKRLNDRNEDNEDEPHIPYRNSKLTRILRDYIGGNAYTSFIITCSKCEFHINQTKNVFIFGQNIRKIKNKPLINVEVNANKSPIEKENILEEYNKISNELNDLTKLKRKYQKRIEQDEMAIKELNKTADMLKSEKKNNLNLYNRFNSLYNKNIGSNCRTPLKSRGFSDQIKNNQTEIENNLMLENHTKEIIDDLLSDKKYYMQQINKFKSQIDDYKELLRENEEKLKELNDELNNKNGEILLLKLEREKMSNRFEDKLYENNEKIQNMEEKISDERKQMENNLYTQIKNSEAIIRDLRETNSESDLQLKKYKNMIEDLNLGMKNLENKYKNIIEDKEKKNYELNFEINNHKIKVSQLENDLFLKESIIKKMNGEIQILKSELSNLKNDIPSNSNILLNNKNDIKDDYVSKMKDLENELSQKSLKIIDLEQKLKESENIVNDYKNKYGLLDKELSETKSLMFDLKKENENLLRQKDYSQKNSENSLSKEREILALKQNNDQFEIKNKDQERQLELLKKMIQNLENDNKSLRNKMNDYEEIKLELESFKNRGTNYNYIEVNKTSLKREYDKLLEENKSLKKSLENK